MDKNNAQSGPLADRFRRSIQASGLSLSELARRSGVDHSRLSRFVRGERDLTLDAVDRLCAVLGVGFTEPEQGNSQTVEQLTSNTPKPTGRPRKDAEGTAAPAKKSRRGKGG